MIASLFTMFTVLAFYFVFGALIIFTLKNMLLKHKLIVLLVVALLLAVLFGGG